MAIDTVEQWRPVVGFEGVYSVSDLGRVRSERYGRMLAPSVDAQGYVRVKLCENYAARRHSVHRLVAAAFIGPPNGLEVNHIDSNKRHNAPGNLEYVTRSENMLHIVRTRGSAGWARKLDDSKVREIRRLVASGLSQSEVGRRFGIASPNINHIVRRLQWKHVA